jgi:putative peptidoglycan lipid II flippase
MIVKSSIQVTIITVLNILLSFLVQLIIAYFYGAKQERDVYFLAMAIPTYVSTVFIGSLGVVFLPKLIKIRISEPEQENIFINIVLNNSIFFLVILSGLGMIFSENILRMTAPGFSQKELEIAVPLLRILFPTIVFQGGMNILSSVYQSSHRFILPAIAPIFITLVSLVVILLFNETIGIKSFAIGTTLGSLVSFLILIPILNRYQFLFNFFNKDFVRIAALAFPLLLSGLVARSITVFERMMASNLPQGSISFLGYSNQIVLIFSAISVNGVSTAIFPILSGSWAKKNIEETIRYYSLGVRLILFITVPIIAFFTVQGEEVIQLIFERGKFDHSTTIGVAQTFLFFSGAFICNSLGSILGKIFYLSEKTSLSSICEILVTLFYIGLTIPLMKLFSYNGLALASSLGAALSVIVQAILANRILKSINLKFILIGLGKITVVSVLSALLVLIVMKKFSADMNLLIKLSISSSLFCISYYCFAYLFKLDEINAINRYIIKTVKLN